MHSKTVLHRYTKIAVALYLFVLILFAAEAIPGWTLLIAAVLVIAVSVIFDEPNSRYDRSRG